MTHQHDFYLLKTIGLVLLAVIGGTVYLLLNACFGCIALLAGPAFGVVLK